MTATRVCRPAFWVSGVLVCLALEVLWHRPGLPELRARAAPAADVDRSPVDLVLTPDEKWLLTANQTAGSVSLVRLADAQVVAEVPCGQRPVAITLTPDSNRVLVTSSHSGELTILAREGERLTRTGSIALGFEPHGVAVSPDGRLAYVALKAAGSVAVVDLSRGEVAARIAVGSWPRYLALSPDGSRLAVGLNGDGGVAVVDPVAGKLLYREEFMGLNLGHMQASADGKFVYFPWMTYRQQPITAGNIRLGWVLASRIARVRLDGPARREALSLDPPGKAIADPHGLALSPDEQWLVASGSGTHELLVYRLPGLPLQDYGGRDHLHPDLVTDGNRFYRIPLGGRPMAVRFSRDGKRVFVANYLLNAVQIVDLASRQLVQTIPLGGPVQPSLARRGEAIFYDGQRSLDQWYSCHSCHYDGHTNAVTMDTRNDGRNGNYKLVLSLRHVTRTGPWTWHGWQKDLEAAVRKSLTDSMLGPEPSAEDIQAVVAFLDTLVPPPNPHGGRELSAAARRGERVFKSDTAGCARCHPAPYFTDGRIHDVGTGARDDAYKGYNPPSLIGIHDRPLYLHDGRARSLEELLRGPHSPARANGTDALTEQELSDLIEYLKTL
jgi:DNA-binding beta-propeller fold protein YncE